MSHGDIEIGETDERDIDGIAADVAAGGLSVGYRFYAAVHADFERLSVFSGLGPACEVDDPKYSGVRSLPVSGFRNYLILYKPMRAGGIAVLRVIHGARDLRRALD